MNTRKLTISSLLLAMGLAMHYLIPGILGAMKTDIALPMMFLAILICEDYKSAVAISIATGILTALTTTFPGGQIPNIIDKIITGQIVFLLMHITKRFYGPVKMFIISALGTLVSGTVFLYSAIILVGLPPHTSFSGLFDAVVIPATIANVIIGVVVYSAIKVAIKGSSFSKANIS